MTKVDLLVHLKAQFPSAKDNIEHLSLAHSVSSLSQVATVSYRTVPAPFALCGRYNTTPIPFTLDGHQVNADAHFLGLTALSTPLDAKVDIVAVTGLGGHAFGSWKGGNKQNMWLRDFLPEDLKIARVSARVMTYGYDSNVVNPSSDQSWNGYAEEFLEALRRGRGRDEEKMRPLILIGHSLGGLIIKQALCEATYKDTFIFKSCYACVFFGVPNRGLDNMALLEMVKGKLNEQLVKNLSRNARALDLLCQNFIHHFQRLDSRTISFFENADTQTVCLNGLTGNWERAGLPRRTVTEYSATGLSCEDDWDSIPLLGDHKSIVKFENRRMSDYRIVLGRIVQLVKEAPSVIERRFVGTPISENWDW